MSKKICYLVFSALFLIGCSTYGHRVAPVPLPSLQNDHVNIDGVLLVARAYVDEDAAEKAFGFNIRGAGLLPVKVVIDNQSGESVRLLGQQTFLLDKKSQAWPLLTARQANERVTNRVQIVETVLGTGTSTVLMGAAGAIAGLAIGVLTGENLGTAAMKGAVLGGAAGAIYGGTSRNNEIKGDIAYDLAGRSLQNQQIGAGELAHGYLFFPGLNEAESAQILRLSLIVKGQSRVVNLSLPATY